MLVGRLLELLPNDVLGCAGGLNVAPAENPEPDPAELPDGSFFLLKSFPNSFFGPLSFGTPSVGVDGGVWSTGNEASRKCAVRPGGEYSSEPCPILEAPCPVSEAASNPEAGTPHASTLYPPAPPRGALPHTSTGSSTPSPTMSIPRLRKRDTVASVPVNIQITQLATSHDQRRRRRIQ